MNTTHSKHDANIEDICRDPEVGALVPDYIVERLDDSASATVEEHLACCAHCKQRYLTVLRIRAASALKKKPTNPVKQLTHS
jgi:hypothetical protein